jgi:hypothetical protein
MQASLASSRVAFAQTSSRKVAVKAAVKGEVSY